MSFFKLGEITTTIAFMPLLFYLFGLLGLWVLVVAYKTLYAINNRSYVQYNANNLVKDINPLTQAYEAKTYLTLLILLTLCLELYIGRSILGTTKLIYYFNETLQYNAWNAFTKILLLVFMLFSVVYINVIDKAIDKFTIALIGTVLFFMMVLVSAHNFIILYVSIEGISLILYVLAAHKKDSKAVESGLKYFFQSSLASVFLLFGVAMIFRSTNHFDYCMVSYSFVNRGGAYAFAADAGLALILISMLFKVSSFPGHFWSPDVYNGPADSILSVFAVVTKFATFIAMFNLCLLFEASHFFFYDFNYLLVIASLASRAIGMIGAIGTMSKNGNIRNFIAYTSINQTGFILSGLTTHTLEGFESSTLYLISYLISLTLFLGILSRTHFSDDGSGFWLENLSLLGKIYKGKNWINGRISSYLLALSIWSMAGLPPLFGFAGKITVWAALIDKMGLHFSGESWTSGLVVRADYLSFMLFLGLCISVYVSIISAWYYFKLIELIAPPNPLSLFHVEKYNVETEVVYDRGSTLVTIMLALALIFWFVIVGTERWMTIRFTFEIGINNGVWGDFLNYWYYERLWLN